MILTTAVGVNGLLRSRRLSLVVCAFSREAESRMTCSGCGGLGGRTEVVAEEESEDRNRLSRTCVEAVMSVRARRSLAFVAAAMLSSLVMTSSRIEGILKDEL